MQRKVLQAIRSIPRLLFAFALYAPMVHGTERPGDGTYLHELGQYADAVTELESDYRSLIERAFDEDRFDLYRNHNRLMGAWLQVDFLQAMVDFAVKTKSQSDEDQARSMLRDHVQYVLWELDNAIDGFAEHSPCAQSSTHCWIQERCRSLLSNVRITVNRMLVDHCATSPCAIDP